MNELIKGTYDLHVHTAPDVVPRKCTDLELAQRMCDCGMKGGAIKCHYGDTSARAALLRQQFPQLQIVGGIVLNRYAGGINPYAVERAAQMGGKFVWFPTLEALSYQKFHHQGEPESDLSGFLSILDEKGNLMPAAIDVLDIAAQYHMVVGTGHIGAPEGMALVREAVPKKVQMVLTHADNPADQYTVEEQREAVRMGAIVEHSYLSTYWHRTPIEEIARQIYAVGCENVILSTDFGQPKSPYFDEGMEQYARLLLQAGLSQKELFQMMVENPRRLIS